MEEEQVAQEQIVSTSITPRQKSNSLLIVVFVSTLTFVIGGVVGHFFVSTEIAVEEKEIEEISQEAPVAEEWNVHEDAVRGVTFEYPPDWTVSEEDGRVSIEGPDVEGLDQEAPQYLYKDYISYSVRDSENHLPIDLWFERNSGLPFLTVYWEYIAVGNAPAVILEAAEGIGDPWYLYVQSGEEIVGFNTQGDPRRSEEIQKILNSFKFGGSNTGFQWKYVMDSENYFNFVIPQHWKVEKTESGNGWKINCDKTSGKCGESNTWMKIEKTECSLPLYTLMPSTESDGENMVAYCHKGLQITTNSEFDPLVDQIMRSIVGPDPVGTKG